MTNTTVAELCRVTVVGPGGRADLAVPVSSTVASLLPTLLAHTALAEQRPAATDPETGASEQVSWVLQRLGEAPFDPDGTPETLDWLEGERLYLRQAENPLPELDFDDVADGMATVVDRQHNHWQPEHARPLFLSLAVVAVATVVTVLVHSPSGTAATIAAGVLAFLFATASVAAGRWSKDRALSALPGLAACVLAAAAGLFGVVGPAHALEPTTEAIVVAALCAAGTAGLLHGARYSVAPRLPIVPSGVVAIAGVTMMVGVWLHSGAEFTREESAAIVCSVFFILMIYSPRIAIRMARLRGPQLPRTADELQIDIDPAPAAEVAARTGFADRYFTVITMSGALVHVAAFPFLLALPGWLEIALPGVFVASLALRARHFVGLLQRLAVTTAATAGVVLLVIDRIDGMSVGFQLGTIVGLLVAIGSLVLAATRQPTRRLLPIWGHLGNIAEAVTAFALLPMMLQVLGVYAWARGLAG